MQPENPTDIQLILAPIWAALLIAWGFALAKLHSRFYPSKARDIEQEWRRGR